MKIMSKKNRVTASKRPVRTTSNLDLSNTSANFDMLTSVGSFDGGAEVKGEILEKLRECDDMIYRLRTAIASVEDEAFSDEYNAGDFNYYLVDTDSVVYYIREFTDNLYDFCTNYNLGNMESEIQKDFDSIINKIADYYNDEMGY